MKRPSLFISPMTAFRHEIDYLERRRCGGSFRVVAVTKLNEDTKEMERGYIVDLSNEHSCLFL